MAFTNTNRSKSYTGRGDAGPYEIDFPVELDNVTGAAKNVHVYVIDALATKTEITDSCTIEGHNVYVPEIDTDVYYDATYTIWLIRETPVTQEVDFPDSMPYAQVTENVADKITYILNELRDLIGRGVRLDTTDEVAALYLPSKENRASTYLYFDADGDIENAPGPPPKFWNANYIYNIEGTVIQHAGSLYKLIVSSDTGTEPGTDDTVWEPIPFDVTWNEHVTYALGQGCFYDAVFYKSLQADNKGNPPDSSPTYWAVAVETLDSISLSDNGDGTLDFTFTFAYGGEHTVTTPDLREDCTDVSVSDNGDGTIDITFAFQYGGNYTVTTPDIRNDIVDVTSSQNLDGSLDLTFEFQYGPSQTITTPVLGNHADTANLAYRIPTSEPETLYDGMIWIV